MITFLLCLTIIVLASGQASRTNTQKFIPGSQTIGNGYDHVTDRSKPSMFDLLKTVAERNVCVLDIDKCYQSSPWYYFNPISRLEETVSGEVPDHYESFHRSFFLKTEMSINLSPLNIESKTIINDIKYKLDAKSHVLHVSSVV